MFKPKEETVEFIAEVLIKVVGESIMARLLRVLFVIAITVGSQFIPTAKEPVDCGPPATSPMQKVQTPH